MLQKELGRRVLHHLSSITLVFLGLAVYLLNDTEWLDSYLPLYGKMLAVFTLLGLIVVSEVFSYRQDIIQKRLQLVLSTIEVNGLKQSVSGLYGRFISSGDEYIENEYTIKELYELIDLRERLNENSYIQHKLEFLADRVKLNND